MRILTRLEVSFWNSPIYQPQGIESYLRAAQIFWQCRKRGKPVRKTIDCIIASICLENDLILLHRDTDFDHIAQCTALKCYKV